VELFPGRYGADEYRLATETVAADGFSGLIRVDGWSGHGREIEVRNVGECACSWCYNHSGQFSLFHLVENSERNSLSNTDFANSPP
jgi:hypothetical protein